MKSSVRNMDVTIKMGKLILASRGKNTTCKIFLLLLLAQAVDLSQKKAKEEGHVNGKIERRESEWCCGKRRTSIE